MSKYQPKIIINNPEKSVPDDIVEQFFLTIKTADEDNIRNFVAQYKTKYNLVGKKENSGKTPIHIVLELDEKIADNDTKLKLIKFLDEMGCPIDLPDSTNTWPIHLAAGLQSKKIANYFIQKNVSINRKDSSNNTPLHYAIYGKNVVCPKPITVGPLTPPEKTDKLPFNKSLELVNKQLINLLSQNPPQLHAPYTNITLNDNLIHIINTIMKIPEMYAYDKLSRNLETDLVDIFTETALVPTYPSTGKLNEPVPTGSLNIQQDKLEQLIDRIYSNVSEDMLRGLTNPSTIAPNSPGWGPKIPTGPLPTDRRDPNNLEKIMEKDIPAMDTDIRNEYMAIRANSTKTIGIEQAKQEIMPGLVNTIDKEYIDKLVFCPGCTSATNNYGENVTLTKMLFLLAWNHYRTYYVEMLAKRIMDSWKFMNESLHTAILDNGTIKSFPYYMFGQDMNNLIDRPHRYFDDIFSSTIRYYDSIPPGGINKCISNNLLTYFDNTFLPPRGLVSRAPNSNVEYINFFIDTPISAILNTPGYEIFKPEFNKLAGRYPGSNKWGLFLDKLIKELEPRTIKPNIFLYPPNTFTLPRTPLPSSKFMVRGTKTTYTIHEMMRIMEMLHQFITTDNYHPTVYPQIFDRPPNKWTDYVEEMGKESVSGSNTTIEDEYPIYIFLYKLLAKFAQRIVGKEIIKCFTRIVDFSIRDNRLVITNNIKSFNDAYMYNLLLPSDPNPSFINNKIFDDAKNKKWTKDNNLVKWFNTFQLKNNLTDFIINLGLKMHAQVTTTNRNPFRYNTLNDIRDLMVNMQSDPVVNSEIDNIINNMPDFRHAVREYFGILRQVRRPQQIISSSGIIPKYEQITSVADLIDMFDEKLIQFRNKIISQTLFLADIYGYLFIFIKKYIFKIVEDISLLNKIVRDIILFINNNTIYYIPQVFLPALIKQIIAAVRNLLLVRNQLLQFDKRKSVFYNLLDINDNSSIIVTLGDEFVNYVNTQLKLIYTRIMDVVGYHNTVVDFLNYTSAYRLASGDRTTGIKRLFSMNLVPIENFPDLFVDAPDYGAVNNILALYKIPNIVYYADPTEVIDSTVFGDPIYEPTSRQYVLNYDNVMDSLRSGKISNCPSNGDNMQINILYVAPDYSIQEIPNPIEGQWINMDKSNIIKYYDAFIAYLKIPIPINWLDGMPPSIRKLAGPYLRMMKQHVIQDTIQYIIDNKDVDPGTNPRSTRNLYEILQNLGSEPTYTLEDVKIYVMVGKLLDSIINKLLEYAIRQSISTWIYNFVSGKPSLKNLTNTINKTIAIIQEKDHMKLSLDDISKEAIDDLMSVSSKYIDFKLTQIESNPNNLKYSTKDFEPNFVHYLYDINYSSQSSINSNKTCYHVNPDLVSQFIIADTINVKNSDGNTPLHLAVQMNNAELVSILVKKGASLSGFSNIHGQNVVYVAISNIKKHLEFTDKPTVEGTVNNFVVPFNDLLLARLKEDKYNNNMIKNITSGIPVQMVIYNHMFHLYLGNYRYNFSAELKKSMNVILKKHFGFEPELYPTDPFQTTDEQLFKILEPVNPSNRANMAINRTNEKKIEYNQRLLNEISNQINGLENEKQRTADTNQKQFIDDILVELNLRKDSYENKIKSLKVTKEPVIDDYLVSFYHSSTKSISTKIGKRILDIVEFYDVAFGRIGKNKDMYLGIWTNYLEKNLINAPSMILSLTNVVIKNIISSYENGGTEFKSELETVFNFYKEVKNYIELKDSFPRSLEENPILYEEFKQISYLINLILTPAVKNIIYSQIYQNLKEMDAANILLGDQTKILDEISGIEFNGQTIDSYLEDILPNLSFKYFTTIYYNNIDSDKKIIDAYNLFLPIIQIIKTNKIIQVTDESTIVQNFKEYLIPFLINTYQNFIHHIRLAIYSYERYLLNTFQLLSIFKSITIS
ncbi:MAG: putative ankyrin repeat protein [Satyrvirus sp.]|uniref:Putative ankyrin repeat protein n=1 Tax=Satyrvirus sp. TaxID=2487771 RepID=A0A3G5ADQ9_9VIRU|nr:MAG: putative ankyrin repeat protein [Satyrvirus sp.]